MTIHRVLLCWLIAGAAGCAPTLQIVEKEGPQDEPNVPSVPTADDFGVKFDGDIPADWKRYGNLQCESDKRETCAVTNMPLLKQGDGHLIAPLKAFMQKYADANGDLTWPTMKGPVVEPIERAVVGGLLGEGCWLTSQTTLIETAIANKPGLALSGRAVEFNAVADDPMLGLSKPEHQMLWQYQHSGELAQSKVKHTQPPAKPYLTLAEFAGDAGGKAGSLGRTRLESPTLVSALQSGELLAIAYGRYQVDVGAPDQNGNRTLSFTRLSQHKVAVSGFRPGAYPVVINDVGDGKRHLVRITTDWRSLTYTSKDSAGHVTTVDASKLTADPKFDGRSLIVYEGAEDITLGESKRQAFFLDDCATLSMP